MTNNRHVDQRSPPAPPNLKKTAAKAQRPSTLSKTLSSSKVPTKGGKNKASHTDIHAIEDKDDDDMATGFLQFCAFCEKQIIVPSNSVLYCSQSCRRKDGEKLPSDNFFPTMYGSTSPINNDLNDPFGFTSRTIVPRRRPTTISNNSSKPPVLHNAKSDLDPTEWKPDLKERAKSDASEAFRYLSQFHTSTPSPASSRRPELQTRSTTSALMAPSLSHTPTTSITSSEASPPGTPSDGVVYDASTSKKSVEIIESKASTGVKPTGNKRTNVVNPIVNDVSYQKKWIVLNQEPGGGSLKKLLHFQGAGEMDEM